VRVSNTGERAGADAVQLYVSGPDWPEIRRLAGFAKVSLEPGESKVVGIEVDPRLLSVWSTGNPGWTRRRGDYTLSVAHSSRDIVDSATVSLTENHLPPEWAPGR
jgi:beta-glucosidase